VVVALSGAVSAEASFASDTVKVIYQPQYLPLHRIVVRINSLGYGVERQPDENVSAEAERRDFC
jgi:copper chaperone CopZ